MFISVSGTFDVKLEPQQDKSQLKLPIPYLSKGMVNDYLHEAISNLLFPNAGILVDQMVKKVIISTSIQFKVFNIAKFSILI